MSKKISLTKGLNLFLFIGYLLGVSVLFVDKAESVPKWLWLNENMKNHQTIYFRRGFDVSSNVREATVYGASDADMTVYLNGKKVMKYRGWNEGTQAQVSLRSGHNVLAVKATSNEGAAGVLLKLRIASEENGDRMLQYVETDSDWKVKKEISSDQWRSTNYDDSGWKSAHSLGVLGVDPWGAVDLDTVTEARKYGPGLSWRLHQEPAAFTMDLGGRITISYDVHQMRQIGVWKGGFLDLGKTMMTNYRATEWAKPDGQKLQGLDYWQWALNGAFDRTPAEVKGWSKRGPAPRDWFQFYGRYRHAEQTILSYRIGDRDVLERPGAETIKEDPVLTHRLEIQPGGETAKLAVGKAATESGPKKGIFSLDGERVDSSNAGVEGNLSLISEAWNGSGTSEKPYRNSVVAAVTGEVEGMTWKVDDQNRIVLQIPPGNERRCITVMRYAASDWNEIQTFAGYVRKERRDSPKASLSKKTNGGPEQWDERITVEGNSGKPRNGYALDTVPVPFGNPYNTWMRTTAVGFLSDGRAVVTTYTGDVWIVSGLDKELDQVTWQRFAAGLYEPMGVQVKDGKIYVTCRTGIIRLHDLNKDGEADFYETFFSDPNARLNWHGYNFDLQIDPDGHFYYAKTGLFNHFSGTPHGSVIRVQPDGKRREIIARGFRVPNGMGMLPDGRPLVSDNEGGWVPASQINVVKEGEFYGFLADATSVPDGFQDFKEPMIWIPQSADPSSGGQMWATGGFGPLSNRLLHTSYRAAQILYVLLQQSGHDINAALISDLPHQFDAGIQRARQNPVTGNVWATGLTGWQGPPDANDGCLQRLRYTGGGARVVTDFHVSENGIRLQFSKQLDSDSAANSENYDLAQWNYSWTQNYGSAHYSVQNPEQKGEDPVPVSSVQVGQKQKEVLLSVQDLQPVDQLRVKLDVTDVEGNPFQETIYLTIHQVPQE